MGFYPDEQVSDEILYQLQEIRRIILVDITEEPVVTPPLIQQHLPIAPDETEEKLSPEEHRKREEFKAKRRTRALKGADGLDLKTVLAHRIFLVEGAKKEDEPKWDETARTRCPITVVAYNSM
ncbi:hypothetical protein FBUS_01556 [Fasciolopsis buskii]|uniref:Uncharacterized protein n=1 Tax=Fasciolopsis buskii TaxID=27845 RepID=A0A8E0VGA1_9TREM|nr:hypothetical protein FBUS_01556 [Fasciolopsis buski]